MPSGQRSAARPAVAADRGLFGPGSVSWRVLAEPVMWIAGIRAMYLQTLHPRAMRAIWQNTAFARPGEAWGRICRTAGFITVRTYGTLAEVERAGRRVRRIHAELTGTDADGSVIRLDEPELLLWVHCGEIASYADVARRCGLPIGPAELDQFIDEQRRAAAVVGIDPAVVPASMAEMTAYYQVMRPRLRVSREARRAALWSLRPDLPRQLAGLRLAVPPMAALAFASLPRWARRLYGTPGTPVTDLTATVTLRALYQATSLLPRPLLGLPLATSGPVNGLHVPGSAPARP